MYHRVLHSINSSVTGSETKNCVVKIECPFCKRVYRKASLRAHLRIHTNERIYPCNQCDWSFARLSNLKNHIKNIHQKEGGCYTKRNMDMDIQTRTVTYCNVCEKEFKTK